MSVKWIDYSATIIDAPTEDALIRKIETAYRICYNSTNKIKDECKNNSLRFIMANMSRGHGSPLEHVNITIEADIDRGLLAEITRHRVGSSYSVSSTRYIKYNTEIPCIMPYEIRMSDDNIKNIFKKSIENSCNSYQELLKLNIKPENARGLLPQSLAVHLMETHNFREWLHIFDLRYYTKTGKPHPDMRIWMHKIYKEFNKLYPNIIYEPILELEEIEKTYKNEN